MKFIHSADWQLGARFTRFGAQAESLRKARLNTLGTALKAAKDQSVDAFIIAGDLFEDNQVEDSLVSAVLDLFTEFNSVPIFVLPGNHDPHTGPDSVWSRRQFANAPTNLVVFREPTVIERGGGYLIASPLLQKVSTIDPSRHIADLVRALPAEAIKVGITHGSIAIPGKHQPNDFPIDPCAATRSGLDYLAVGHWHNWQIYDGGRLVMPGTPEQDAFDHADSGFVACVEIKTHGESPIVERLPVSTLQWETLAFDFLDVENAKLQFLDRVNSLRERANRIVLRATLTGSATPSLLESTKQWLGTELADFFVSRIEDLSSTALSAAELQALQQDHPLLAHVLDDLAHLEHLLTGAPPPAGHDSTTSISLTDAQKLADGGKIDMTRFDTSHFNLARRILLQKLREVEE